MVSHILDYILFGGLVVGTGAVGFYFGALKRSKSIAEYMTGNRNGAIPLLLSTIVTFTTPKQMIADPTAVILFGTQTESGIAIGILLGAALYMTCFLPVTKRLMTSRSLLNYFELRHNKTVRIIAAAVMIFREVVVLPSLIYIPALVLNEMLGLPQIYTTTALTFVCLLYTCTGGLKAVIWTDSLQYGYFIVSVVVCAGLGVYKVGGVARVWQDSVDGGRAEFLSFRGKILYDRANFLGGLSTGTLYALSVGITDQTFFQRLYSLKDKSTTNSVAFTSFIGFFVSRCNGLITGLIVYSYFKDCDPLLTKEITKADGIVPLFIRKMSETVPGVLGLFLAGMVAAALSTISSSLNTAICLIHDNIVVNLVSHKLPERTSFLVIRYGIIVIAICALCVTPMLHNFHSMQQLTLSVAGLTTSTNLSLFSGMVNPWVNNKGLITGTVAGLAVSLTLFSNQLLLMAQGKLTYSTKLITTAKCYDVSNATVSGYEGVGARVYVDPDDNVAKFTAISYLWYSLMNLMTSLVVSSIVSFFTKETKVSTIDVSLICPPIRGLLRKRTLKEVKEVDNENEMEPLNTSVSNNEKSKF